MRIKYYREFKPSDSEKDEIIQNLKDILLELPEENHNIGYNIEYVWAKRITIGYHDMGVIPAEIQINLSDISYSSNIKYKYVEDYVIRVKDYLESLGLRMTLETAFGESPDDWKNGIVDISSYRMVFSI